MLWISPCCLLQVEINFSIAWKRDTADGKTNAPPRRECDEAIIANRDLMGQPVPWRCLSGNCGQIMIGVMEYICTSFSVEDNWSMGTNSIIFDFPVASNIRFTVG